MGFQGEAEFHIVAAGHATNVVYVYNTASNSHMPFPGIHKRLEAGGWRRASGHGLAGDLMVLAVHPTESETIAAATTAGLFLSPDGGDEFHQLAVGHVTAAHFTLEGNALWFAVFESRLPRLFYKSLTHAGRQEIKLPAIGADAVAYIAQNPVRRTEFAIVSFQRSVSITVDSGETWQQIARARGSLPE